VARITIELEPSDIDKLLDLQHEMFDALLRIEKLLKEIKSGNDTGSESKKGRSKSATKS